MEPKNWGILLIIAVVLVTILSLSIHTPPITKDLAKEKALQFTRNTKPYQKMGIDTPKSLA